MLQVSLPPPKKMLKNIYNKCSNKNIWKKVCWKKYWKKNPKKPPPFFATKYTKNEIKFISKTEPALNEPLWLICRKTKQKHAAKSNLNFAFVSLYWLKIKNLYCLHYVFKLKIYTVFRANTWTYLYKNATSLQQK